MGFRINTNINAVDTERNLLMTSTSMATTMRRLSSGLRINSAADDAAGLAIGQKLNAQVNGLNQAQNNAQDGISLIQTADGALNETQAILQRMRTLAVQAANDTNTASDRVALQTEMNQLATEVTRISNTTSFNTKNLLAGNFLNQQLQIGANQETMALSLGAMDAQSLGIAASGATLASGANGTNISSFSNLGQGFTNNAAYLVRAATLAAGSLTDATGAAQVTGSGIATTAQPNQGNEALAVTGTFAGSSATNYVVRVTSVNATQVAAIQYSTDGGTTFANATGQMQNDGSVTFQVQQSSASGGTGGDSGLKLNFTVPANATTPQVGDQFTFNAAAGQSFVAQTSIGGGTTFALNAALPLVDGTYNNGSSDGTAPTATIQGAYSGPYSGTLSITTNMLTAPGTANVWDPGTQLTVKIGNTTIDSSQYQVNTTNNTLSLFGLTIDMNTGVGGSTGGASGLVTMTEANALTPGNSGSAGLTSVTVGNSGMLATPTATATATQSGQFAAGLGAGSIALEVTQFGTNPGDPYGINNIAWLPTGATTAPTFLAQDFSYSASSGGDVYTAGHTYGGAITVTGQDGKPYTITVSNSSATGATVTVADSTQTYATYTVAASTMTQPNDTIDLNLSPANDAASLAPSHNIGQETATVSGTYTGTQNTAFMAKVAAVDANGNATEIQLSTDGGATYGAAIQDYNPSGALLPPGATTTFTLGNGLTLTMNPVLTSQLHATVGDAFQFVATASAANGGTGATLAQMQTTGTGTLGDMGVGQLVLAGQSAVTLGTGPMQATANFTAPGSPDGLAAGTSLVNVTASQAAIFDNTGAMTSATVGAALDITTQADAQAAITTLDAAINTVSSTRATLGAAQNRLSHTLNSLAVESENLNAAQSRIMDVDVASETVNMTKDQILQQAGISVLSQANQQPQMVLKLLQ